MPPKGHVQPISEVGCVRLHRSTFRVEAFIDGKRLNGPSRATEAEALEDLQLSRLASTRLEFKDTRKSLRRGRALLKVAGWPGRIFPKK